MVFLVGMLSLAQVIHRRMLFVSMLGVGLTFALLFSVVLYQNWGWRERIQKETIDFHKQQLHGFIAMVDRYVAGEIKATEDRLQRELTNQMDQAWSLLLHVEEQNKHLSKKQRIRAVAEALRPLRFKGESGYFFITAFDGIEVLFPPNPKMLEGVNVFKAVPHIRDVVLAHDSIVKNHGEGFHRYMWYRPAHPGKNHIKVSYVRAYKELGLTIGTGMYWEEMEPLIQEETISHLSKMNLGTDAYIFVSDWDGVVQLGPAKGKNMLHVRDKSGMPVVKTLIELSKQGGGFLEYHMPSEVGDSSIHKMSYVIGIPEWRWYVGVGRNIKNLETTIAAKEQEIIRQYVIAISVSVILGIFLMILIAFVSKRTAGWIGGDLNLFLEYFRQAGRALRPLHVGNVHYRELSELAHEANAMVNEIRLASQEKEHALVALENKNKELEQILFIAGHDLRTPLVTLQGFTGELNHVCKELGRICKDSSVESEERKHELIKNTIPEANRFIQSAAVRMETLLGGVLQYGRMSRIQPDLQEVDVEKICHDCLSSMGLANSSKDIQIHIEPLPRCYADSALVMQIVGNLFENAVKYKMPERPLKMIVSGEEKEAIVRISFEDNGLGISEKDLKKVFALFMRGQKTTGIQGEGLGLSISRGLAKKMNGELWVESKEGTGSTFILQLPAMS